jgi:hypothetical protein
MTSVLFAYRGPSKNPQRSADFAVYEHIRDSEWCAGDREALDTMWARFSALGLADPEFVERFPTEFGAKVWEMRLACALDAWGWKLMRSRSRPGHGPDFGIEMSDGRVMWVEATAPGNAEGPEAIHAPARVVLNGNDIDRKVLLRYLNAIDDKRKQYARWLSDGVVGKDDGFTIAISGSMVPEGLYELDEMPRIVRVAFGLGRPTFTIPLRGDGTPTTSRPAALAVTKRRADSTDVPIQSGLFVDGDAPEISAILFSQYDIKNRPEARGREAARDFVLVHNPFANVPFPFGEMRAGREFYMRVGLLDHREPIAQ